MNQKKVAWESGAGCDRRPWFEPAATVVMSGKAAVELMGGAGQPVAPAGTGGVSRAPGAGGFTGRTAAPLGMALLGAGGTGTPAAAAAAAAALAAADPCSSDGSMRQEFRYLLHWMDG